MKKRLRKKRHIGEFKEWGVSVAVCVKKEADFSDFLYDFIEQAVDCVDCYFAGGEETDCFEGFVELGKGSDTPEEKLQEICAWLSARTDVAKYATGRITDAWYGPFDEPGDIGEKL